MTKSEYQLVWIDESSAPGEDDDFGCIEAMHAAQYLWGQYLTREAQAEYPNARVEIMSASEVGSFVAANSITRYREIPDEWYQDAWDSFSVDGVVAGKENLAALIIKCLVRQGVINWDGSAVTHISPELDTPQARQFVTDWLMYEDECSVEVSSLWEDWKEADVADQVETLRGHHYLKVKNILDELDWDGIWPEVYPCGSLTGRVLSEWGGDDYLLVDIAVEDGDCVLIPGDSSIQAVVDRDDFTEDWRKQIKGDHMDEIGECPLRGDWAVEVDDDGKATGVVTLDRCYRSADDEAEYVQWTGDEEDGELVPGGERFYVTPDSAPRFFKSKISHEITKVHRRN